jgi:hypothetical protein
MNTYEITYKTSANARKVFTAIRFGETEEKAKNCLVEDGYVVTSIKLVGEYGGAFCGLN